MAYVKNVLVRSVKACLDSASLPPGVVWYSHDDAASRGVYAGKAFAPKQAKFCREAEMVANSSSVLITIKTDRLERQPLGSTGHW